MTRLPERIAANGIPIANASAASPTCRLSHKLLAPKLGSTVERPLDVFVPKDDHAPTTIRHAAPRASYKELSRVRRWPNPEKRGKTIRYLNACTRRSQRGEARATKDRAMIANARRSRDALHQFSDHEGGTGSNTGRVACSIILSAGQTRPSQRVLQYKIRDQTQRSRHPFHARTHPPSPQSALEVDNPQNTTPAKSRKVERMDDSSFARTQRHLRSPEDRIATCKSSLPSSSALNTDDDPFSLGYQLAHRAQSGLVTHSATPLAFTEDEELEEGELFQDIAQPATPRARATHLPNHTGSVSPAPSLPASLPPVSRSVSPAASEHSDVPMEDDTDYGALVRDPGFGAKAPTHHDEDPHVAYDGFNPTDPDDHAGVPFQKHAGGGARLVMSHETMMTNALKRVVDLIASDPDRFILFMPFLGRHHFHNRYRNAATDLAKQLEQVTGAGGIAIYPPSADDANKANFAGNPLYHPTEIRDSVARHELIACNEDLTVHVSKVDMGRQSWCLGQFRCNSIAPLTAAVPRGAVAVHVFEQGPLRTAIVHATQNEPGSADKRVFDFAETLRATYLESPTEPIWVIYGRPFTKDHATWERFRDLFCNTKFASGLVEFTPIGSPNRAAGDNIRRLALCYICKLEDHRSDTCPYRSLTDFVGPKDVLKPAREGILALVKGKPGARPHDDVPSPSHGRNQRRRRF
ncbi:hypothetical protein B0H14DRAFT_3755379 [Mycena olivaceomarginata]|nr:hypothetical protein B0H14DRAFT_3755379 [Mycena olivaceomarginata]